MILLRCSESQSGENFKTSADKRQGETMNLISVAMFALNVNVDGNSRQARVNGRSDCVGVLWRAVLCCAVVCCGCRRHFFAHFLTKKRITFHGVCFSKPLTFHNDFMFFCFSLLFQALFETSSPT